MNKQANISEYRNGSCSYDGSAGGTVCLGEPTTAGRPDDKFLENTLVFDISSDISLTKREGEILQMIVSGQTNKQIAQRLSRRMSAVKSLPICASFTAL